MPLRRRLLQTASLACTLLALSVGTAAAACRPALPVEAAGNVTTETLPAGNGHVATRSFDRAGRLTTVENAKAGTILSKFLWTLDATGNPTKQQTTRGASDSYDAFEYDTRNRLTVSCFGVSAGATNCSGAADKITYAYDKLSNRTQEVRSGSVGNTGTIDYTYNAADQLTQSVKGGNTTTYTYDANGNQASIGTRSFTYDLASRLVSTTNAGTTTTYGYDGDGRRVSSTVGGGGADLRFVWDPLAASGLPELALERTPAGGLVRRYLAGPLGAFSFTDGSATFSFHRDPLGTVTDVTDATGAAQWRYEYEPYGAERTATNVSGSAPESRLRFNGQSLDPETSLYHLRARQYDPGSGRFGALDPLENPLTAPYDGAYVYVNGRPSVLVDPLGLSGRTIGNAIAGVVDYPTFGLSTRGLNAVGIHPDTGSTSFRVGQGIGFGATTLLGGYGVVRGGLTLGRLALAGGGLRAASPSLIRAGVSGAGNIAVGYGLSYFACRPYSLENALLDFGLGGLTGFRSGAGAAGFAAKAGDDLPKVVNWGQQEKHFLGHSRFELGRSELTADPRKLILRAGSGDPVGRTPRGQPAFKERIDFDEVIGTWLDDAGNQMPTTRGILHYGKRGIHIVPSRPR